MHRSQTLRHLIHSHHSFLSGILLSMFDIKEQMKINGWGNFWKIAKQIQYFLLHINVAVKYWGNIVKRKYFFWLHYFTLLHHLGHHFSRVLVGSKHLTVQIICNANSIGNYRTPKLLRFQRFPIWQKNLWTSVMDPEY